VLPSANRAFPRPAVRAPMGWPTDSRRLDLASIERLMYPDPVLAGQAFCLKRSQAPSNWMAACHDRSIMWATQV